MRHEYTAWTGVLPMDAFTKGLTFSGAYTLHFSDLVAWEVANFTYSIGIDTRLSDELANLPQPVGATPFETVEYYGTSNFVIKPIYGKMAVLNRALLYQELFFALGAGVGWLTVSTRPVIDAGIGARFYAGQHVSLRIDARETLFVTGDDLHNEIWLGLGLSLSFGG